MRERQRAAGEPRWTRGLGLVAPLAVVIAGAAATVLVADYEDRVSERELQRRADRTGDRVADELSTLLETEIGGAAATAAALSVDPYLDRATFGRYAASIEDQLPSLLGVGYIRRVATADLDALVATERARGAPDFEVRDLVAGPEHAILLYNEPAAELRGSWGVDVRATPEAAHALDRATDAGRAAVTSRVVLAVDRALPVAQRPAGYVVYAPVWEPGSSTDTVPERRRAVVGWSNLPFRAQDLLDRVVIPSDTRVVLREGGTGRTTIAAVGPTTGTGAATSVHEVGASGTEIGWVVQTSVPATDLDQPFDRRTVALVAGAGLTALLAALVTMLARGSRIWAYTARRATRRLAESERRLREHTRELERSNRDLEAIATIAAHDLAEPLTVIGGYADLLEQRYPVATTIDEAAVSHLRTISGAVQRMRAMLDALLRMSSMPDEVRELETVPLAEVVRDAMANAESALTASGAEVVVGPLPSVRGRRDLLVELVQNLLVNASRHGAADRPLRITVDAGREAAGWQITVADNGKGVPAAQRGRIFQAFRRLDGSGPGLGIGLSIARRIVQLHGGRIEAGDAPGGGAAFTFTLPDDAATPRAGRTGPA
jgi:signal transduction histidine kinase